MFSNIENKDRITGLLCRNLFDDERADRTELCREDQPHWLPCSMFSWNRRPSALSFWTLRIEEFTFLSFDSDDPNASTKANKKHVHFATYADAGCCCGSSKSRGFVPLLPHGGGALLPACHGVSGARRCAEALEPPPEERDAAGRTTRARLLLPWRAPLPPRSGTRPRRHPP